MKSLHHSIPEPLLTQPVDSFAHFPFSPSTSFWIHFPLKQRFGVFFPQILLLTFSFLSVKKTLLKALICFRETYFSLKKKVDLSLFLTVMKMKEMKTIMAFKA